MGAADWMEALDPDLRAEVEQAAGIGAPRPVVTVPEVRPPLSSEPSMEASAASIGSEAPPLDPLDYAQLLGPDVAKLMEDYKLPEKGLAELRGDILNPPKSIPGPIPFMDEDQLAGPFGSPSNAQWAEQAAQVIAEREKAAKRAEAKKLYAGFIRAGVDPRAAMTPEELALATAPPALVAPEKEPAPKKEPAPLGTSPLGGKEDVPPPPGGAGGGRGGAGFSFRGALPGIAGEIARRRGMDDKLVADILEEGASATNDLIGAERVQADVEATIAENQRPIIKAQIANDLYAESLQVDLATKHAEAVRRRVQSIDSRIASYASRQIEDFDLGAAGTIGVALGGLAAAIRADGGPNRVLALVERMIERDIDKQKFEMEKERGLIGMESDRLQAEGAEFQSELTRLRVMRAERWARSQRLIESQVGEYAGILGQAKSEMAIGAIRERAVKERLAAAESGRADATRSFDVQVDAMQHSERMWMEGQRLAMGGGGDIARIGPEQSGKIATLRSGIKNVQALKETFKNQGWEGVVTQFFPSTEATDYEAQRAAFSMFLRRALSGLSGTDKELEAITGLLAKSRNWSGTAESKFNALLNTMRTERDSLVGTLGDAGYYAEGLRRSIAVEDTLNTPPRKRERSQ